jgi:hypothetical protein
MFKFICTLLGIAFGWCLRSYNAKVSYVPTFTVKTGE